MWENEESWFFPELTREQARTILQGAEMGVFLVRGSSTADVARPVLSVSHLIGGSQKIIHFAIDNTSDGHFAHGKLTFPSLHAFLQHYRTNPLTDDGQLRLTNPADVKYFARNDWTGSDDMTKKVASSQQSTENALSLLSVHCGQILRLVKRKPTNPPITVDDCADAKLWLMETEDHAIQGLVPNTCMLIYVRSEYESFMQRQRHIENVSKMDNAGTLTRTKDTIQQLSNIPTPPPLSISRPAALTNSSFNHFSDRRLGHLSEFQLSSVISAKHLAINDNSEHLPSKFPAKAVAVHDRNPNFYDRTQLRFKKGDILTVSKPVSDNTLGVDDGLAYGWAEASIDENGKKGLVPLFANAYLRWL